MNINKQGYNRNISKLITSIFRNGTIFQNILKWNRGQTKQDEKSIKITNCDGCIIKKILAVLLRKK